MAQQAIDKLNGRLAISVGFPYCSTSELGE
jgi:hypothetical protein